MYLFTSIFAALALAGAALAGQISVFTGPTCVGAATGIESALICNNCYTFNQGVSYSLRGTGTTYNGGFPDDSICTELLSGSVKNETRAVNEAMIWACCQSCLIAVQIGEDRLRVKGTSRRRGAGREVEEREEGSTRTGGGVIAYSAKGGEDGDVADGEGAGAGRVTGRWRAPLAPKYAGWRSQEDQDGEGAEEGGGGGEGEDRRSVRGEQGRAREAWRVREERGRKEFDPRDPRAPSNRLYRLSQRSEVEVEVEAHPRSPRSRSPERARHSAPFAARLSHRSSPSPSHLPASTRGRGRALQPPRVDLAGNNAPYPYPYRARRPPVPIEEISGSSKRSRIALQVDAGASGCRKRGQRQVGAAGAPSHVTAHVTAHLSFHSTDLLAPVVSAGKRTGRESSPCPTYLLQRMAGCWKISALNFSSTSALCVPLCDRSVHRRKERTFVLWSSEKILYPCVLYGRRNG
ncbi:hypothetical protein DFH09DRAFT_1092253 [Mycena vulgaris]|nr:hypothetical protein DFH09DRAFT_1092253 [Mycena vulgaris]